MFDLLTTPLLHLFGATACASTSFFGIPTWYTYLSKAGYFATDPATGGCVASSKLQFITGGKLDLSVLGLLGLGILDILLRVGALVSVGFIIYAGFEYITAQGEADKASKALGTIINACIGLGITLIAAATVSFVGGRLGS